MWAPGGVDEVVAAVLAWPTGPVALVDCALVTARREEIEVVGTDGRLVVPTAFLPGAGDVELYLVRGGEATVERVTGVDEYQVMVEEFADAVLGRAPLTLPPEDAVGNARVLEALHRALRAGHPERLE